MKRNKIAVKKKPVALLMRHIDEGRFAIPRLQREFVWDGPKAAKLFDSIYQRMPIGLVMIWETPRSQRLYLRQKYHILPPFNSRNGKVWFLIDGQQRVSVLHRVREGGVIRNARGKEVDFQRVVLSMEKEEDGQQIRYRKPLPGRHVTLRDVLHPQWRSRLNNLGKRYLERVRKCRERIMNYPVYVMFLQAEIGVIRESFLRVNTQGMKITTADAIFTKAEGLDLRDIRHEVNQHVDESFGLIPEMPILFAIGAVRGATEARGQALRLVIAKLEKEVKRNPTLRKTLAHDWQRLSVCFGKALDYLRQNFMVLGRDFLYTDYIIAVLALFFYWNGRGPSSKQKEQIRKWFWSTNVGSRYSGHNFLLCLPLDVKFFKRLAEDPRAKFKYKPQMTRSDVRRAQYTSRSGITSAFYSMMLLRRPVSIVDNGLNEIPLDRYSTRANRKDRHHIFPKAALHAFDIHPSLINSICNLCLLTAEENVGIGSRRPRLYLGDVRDNGSYFKRKMARHLIPVDGDSGVWSVNVRRGFQRFMNERVNMICRALEEEAGTRLFQKNEV